jgi:small subunit ribosomal protein S9
MVSEWQYQAVGRRKNAVARVCMRNGSGLISINDRKMDEYFGRKVLQMVVMQPFELVQMGKNFDVMVNVNGGGLSGQAEAIRHGITRALMKFNPELRVTLKRAGYVTRDAREVERKKYGQRGARARFQYSKR